MIHIVELQNGSVERLSNLPKLTQGRRKSLKLKRSLLTEGRLGTESGVSGSKGRIRGQGLEQDQPRPATTVPQVRAEMWEVAEP